MSTLALSCFGPFQAALDGEALTRFHSVKAQALLAYLALEFDRPHLRETLATLLWPLDNETSARGSLRQTLYELRKLLGDRDDLVTPFLLVTRQAVQFNLSSDHTLDVADFLSSIQGGRLEQAAALYRGELLAGLSCESEPFEEWLRQSRARFHNLAVDVCFKLTDQALGQGDLAQARTYAVGQLTLEPWSEEAHRQLMTALALAGERSAALAQYEICRRTLAAELGVEPDVETTRLYEQIKAGKLRGQRTDPLPAAPTGHPPSGPRVGEGQIARPTPLTVRHNLPPQPTPFIGRQNDLAQIATRLADPACRLLTVVGPGGMGKTRLALQAAQAILDFGFLILESAATSDENPKSEIRNPEFEDGVFFVALAGVGSPDLLVSTIAVALDFTFYGSGEPKTQLLAYLKSRSVLIVLDNCEHLLDGIDLVSELLVAAPDVKVLATSRESLNLREEWLHLLTGMSYPLDETVPVRLESYTAVQFFVQCARRMQAGFDLAAEAAAVVRICRLVEGMPLGIELATTWLKFYSCEYIAREIIRNLDFLATRLRNMPARHHSMRAIFEHSWGLLTAAEQQRFMRLTVFHGGFPREAAEQVANATLSFLIAFSDKSLLHSTPHGRFQMHELLRQFAWEKLNLHPPDREDAQDRHTTYYCRWLARQTERLQGVEHLAALREMEEEIENIRAAWTRAVAQERLDEIEQTLDSLFLFHAAKCWFAEGRALFEQATTALNRGPTLPERTQIVLAQVLTKQTRMQNRLVVEGGMLPMLTEAAAAFQQALLWLEPVDLPNAKAEALVGLGSVYASRGDYRQTLWLNEQAAACYERSNNNWGRARTFHNCAMMATHLGDYSAAKHYCRQGLALAHTLGDQRLLGDLFQVFSEAHRALGEYNAAIRLAEGALAARTAISNQRGIAFALALLGDLAWRTGNYETAWRYANQSQELFFEIGLTRAGDTVGITLANIACSLGNWAEARNQLRALILPRLEANDHTWNGMADVLIIMAILLVKEANVREAVELAELALHHPTARQETRDRATQLLTELQPILPPEVVAAAQLGGRTNDLRITVARLIGMMPAYNG